MGDHICKNFEDFRLQADQLLVGIRRHRQATGVLRAAGAVAGIGGGVCAIRAGCNSESAEKLTKWSIGLTAGFIGAEAVAGLADLLSKHKQQMSQLLVKVQSTRDVALLQAVMVPPAEITPSRERARAQSNEVAGTLLRKAMVIAKGAEETSA